MEHTNNNENEKNLTVEDVVCKWYWGAAVGAGVGYLCGHALIGVIIGVAVGFVFQTFFHSNK